MNTNSMIACHECDLLHRIGSLPESGVAVCTRCGAILHKNKKDSLNRTLSLTIAGLILFVVANTHPFLALKSGGLVQQTTLITGINELYAQGMEGLALLVLFTTILAPLIHITGMLYVLLPLKLDKLPRNLPGMFRLIQGIQPWAMMEVFMVGILVALVKLAKMAKVVPGVALYAFMALIFVMAASAVFMDAHLVWERWEQKK